MSLRYLQRCTKLALPVNRRYQICHTNLTSLLSNNSLNKNILIRQILTDANFHPKKLGLFQSLKQKVKLQLRKYRLKSIGYQLYECVADQLDYRIFMMELRMSDTFNSWFLITELHVWMLMAALMEDPTSGRFIRNCIVEAMWNDVTTRSKKLDVAQISVIKSQIQILSEEFQGALVNYDEGLLSSDCILASAIWRRFLQRNISCKATDVEAIVKYVRQTMVYLDTIHFGCVTETKHIQWIPFSKIHNDLSR